MLFQLDDEADINLARDYCHKYAAPAVSVPSLSLAFLLHAFLSSLLSHTRMHCFPLTQTAATST